MSCFCVISHSDFFSLGFPLTLFSKLPGSSHPRLAFFVASVCHQSCSGQRHCSSEDNNLLLQHLCVEHSPTEERQPSHPEREVSSGTSPGPQFDLTALLGGVFTPGLHPTSSVLLRRTEPSIQWPSMQLRVFCAIYLSLSLQKLNGEWSSARRVMPRAMAPGTRGTAAHPRNSSLQHLHAELVFIIKL